MSSKQISCIPCVSSYPPKQSSFKKSQRFKVFRNKGRIEDTYCSDNLIKRDDLEYYTSSNTKDISQRKLKLLAEWESLCEKENSSKTSQKTKMIRKNELSRKCLDSSLRVEPTWLKNDKEVLRFKLYFEENIAKPSRETYRVRKFTLLYYLSDSQIEINEEKEENSGIVQGKFLKKTLIRKKDGNAFQANDLKIGATLHILGRNFICYDCDNFTRDYHIRRGVSMPSPADTGIFPPLDDYHSGLREEKAFEKIARKIQINEKLKSKRADNLRQYLDNDRKVLRFYCVWDDTRQYGLKNHYILHYFLSDDTIEIRNMDCGQNGKDRFPLLFKRQKLVKDMTNQDSTYYCSTDLLCGQFINVLTRELFLESCDDFTKDYYANDLNIKQPTVLVPNEKDLDKRQLLKTLPPYNGFGSEADSLANCLHLIPKPVKQDLKRFLKNRGKKLQFNAKFSNPKQGDEERKFVITFFMDDDSCSVYEPTKNAGIIGGKFLERGKYKKPINKINRNKPVSKEMKKLQLIVQEKIKSKMVGGPFGLLRAFRQFAINANCMINVDGFKVGLRTVGILNETASDRDIKELFGIYDNTGDGQIDFQEFVDNVMGDRVVPVNESNFSGRALRASDFFVGAKIQFLFPQTGACSPKFALYKATKKTLELMEQKEHENDFPKSNVESILRNIATIVKEFNLDLGRLFSRIDNNNDGYISTADFGNLLRSWAVEFNLVDNESSLTDHEVLTLCRLFDREGDGKIDFSEFRDALTSRVKVVTELMKHAEQEEKVARNALRECIEQVLLALHKFDEAALLQKFLGQCKTHPHGISRDLFLFFLRDEVGVKISADIEIELMLLFDKDCDGRISISDFKTSLYTTKDSQIVEKTVQDFFKLSSKQKNFHKPGFHEYQTLLKGAQLRTSTEITLKKLVKRFNSAYFKDRTKLMKALYTYDIHRTNFVLEKDFFRVLKTINEDFSSAYVEKLRALVFKSRNKIEYDTFLRLFFQQNYDGLKKFLES